MVHAVKKHIVIEAWQFNAAEFNSTNGSVPDWLFEAIQDNMVSQPAVNGNFLKIDTTHHGIEHVNDTDWIIRGVKGELYPITNEIFTETYNIVEE